MNLSSEDKKKIGVEAQRRYNATPALKNHYGTFKAYLGKVADRLVEYQGSQALQADFQTFENYQAYCEGMDLGQIKERKKVA